MTPTLCAHSRSRVTGCTRCLDVCPASAIAPDGDGVTIDPFLCGGCGGCNSVCPTGAVSYAMPAPGVLAERLRTLLTTYFKAGGAKPVLFVHDGRHGEEMISLIARHGRGLPARVIPVAVNEITQVGFDFFASAIAYGAEQVLLLVPSARRDELDGLAGQVGLAEALTSGLGLGSGRVSVITDIDPETVEWQLWNLPPQRAVAPADLPADGRQARGDPTRARPSAQGRTGAGGRDRAAAGRALRRRRGRRGGLHALPRLRRRVPDRRDAG